MGFKGNEETRFEIGWCCKFEITPSLALLFSSANASQNALWVMKLSLLHILNKDECDGSFILFYITLEFKRQK